VLAAIVALRVYFRRPRASSQPSHLPPVVVGIAPAAEPIYERLPEKKLTGEYELGNIIAVPHDAVGTNYVEMGTLADLAPYSNAGFNQR